ncbi:MULTISPECIES: inositol monophosphatase family protein [unclassified Arthrobacter]|uniref:inositol monophosphatase family protein n=1 Tax=unclassified Arthrobacter TaxID=235627 RepID=UPI001D14B63F|nr:MULTISPECIES: inositol monophosphatase family protein [unclassified Arthrobacter]MCC3276646.1 inositol monophosphatase family protein [Arthrobacter sp. zg-Y20]MCC3279811.1 inositol monophosphatase family protein [Arthrobacter sp. zg-Y40]MCC9178427.1 inositol monophosphatase family protein [Arthrobacter sp. zg-Y750]MDK1316805.1 inositol monophosphatase family protein [Arthrobacter sp. zg.Y20]MDK1328179.1 inositol monophosphatase family protein [Arthrobacter sp. zg-Y1143]
MSENALPEDFQLAADLVREAGQLALQMRAEGLTASQKTSVSDVVTAADREAEALVVRRLRELRPDDGIVGEEGASHNGTSGRSWVIDPVDGTYNFFTGSTYWCSAIALRSEPGPHELPGDPDVLLGAIYQPQEDLLWVGGKGRPATLNGEPIGAPADEPLNRLCAGTYLHPTWLQRPEVVGPWTAAASRAATLRMMGSGSCDLGRVASGQPGAWFQHSCPEWDWLPGKAIVLAAGGSTAVVEVNGFRWHIAGSAGAVREIHEALTSA